MAVSPATLKRAFESGEFSDVTIWVDDEEFKLHKLVVGGKSSVLKEMFKDVNSITLKPMEDLVYNGVYKAVFRFMYGLGYDDGLWANIADFQFYVYRVARRYEVLGLQKLALEKVKKIANKDAWNADQFINILENRLHEDNITGDKELFDFLIDTCHEHIDELANDFGFEDVLEHDHALAKYLIQSWGDSLTKYRCPTCDKVWPMDSKYFSLPLYCPSCGHREENWRDFMD